MMRTSTRGDTVLLTSQVRKAGERYVGEPVIRAKHSECLLREAALRLLGRPACLVQPYIQWARTT
jgi:hypothetical protein